VEKKIVRTLGFNKQDVCDAIIGALRNRDHPVPPSNQYIFELTPTGAKLEWTEESED
jgi:hypothetical protein